MAEHKDDLDFEHLFRVIFIQGGQVAIGTAIGAGVLLLVGIVGVLLSPVLLPVFLFLYWKREKAKKAAAALAEPAVEAAAVESTPVGGGDAPAPGV